jgi:delta1-piperideine-2-carboxylate reductase
LPFGGHKGSALSMMVELLAAALTGGNFSFEFDWSNHPGCENAMDRAVVDCDRSEQSRRARVLPSAVSELVRQMHGVGTQAFAG